MAYTVARCADRDSEEASSLTYRVNRDRMGVSAVYHDRASAEREAGRLARQEAEARAALASGDPRAVCRIGWHRGFLDDLRMFFRWGGMHGGWMYWVSIDAPFEFLRRRFLFLKEDDGQTCHVCGERVPPE